MRPSPLGSARSLGIDVLVLWVGALSDADTEDHMKEVANVGVGLAANGSGSLHSGLAPILRISKTNSARSSAPASLATSRWTSASTTK